MQRMHAIEFRLNSRCILASPFASFNNHQRQIQSVTIFSYCGLDNNVELLEHTSASRTRRHVGTRVEAVVYTALWGAKTHTCLGQEHRGRPCILCTASGATRRPSEFGQNACRLAWFRKW